MSNNVYAKFGAAMTKIMELISKETLFHRNRLATLVIGLLGNVGDLSFFILCPIMFMPSLTQLGLTE